MDAILIAWTVLGVLSLALIIRNELVFNYRSKVYDAFGKWIVTTTDHIQVAHRLNHMNDVKYLPMLMQFWKKPKSFYDDNFLQELGIK